MKKLLVSYIALFLSFFAYAQPERKDQKNIDLRIRTERKELKREHYSNRPSKSEFQIHRHRHELHHGKNKQHEWKRKTHMRPVKKATPRKKRAMLDRRNK